MSALITGSCPNCGSKLSYEQNQSTVTCYACDSTIRISDIAAPQARASSVASKTAFAAFTGFDNPESGVVFLENFFETYDWESYQTTPDITIPEIADVIGNNKVKNGAIPETWYLDFLGLYTPITKKFEGLKICEKNIVEKFNPIDPTEILGEFDTYKIIAETLLLEKENIFKVLESAIKFAERFSLSANRLSEMKSNLASLKAKYDTICTKTITVKDNTLTVVVDNIEAMKAYDIAKQTYANKANDKYIARGIDAKEIYNRAVQAYNSKDAKQALALFESIRDYSDSALYISKLNQYFNFFDKVYRFDGKHFIYKEEDYTQEALNLKKLSKKVKQQRAEAGEADIMALSLYEVVDGLPAKKPAIKGIDKVIACYGTRLFYFKSNKGIASYDFTNGMETIIDAGSEDLYKSEDGKYVYGVANSASTFFVKKKFREDIKGCLGKKKGTLENDLNPYTVILVDMATNTCRIVANELLSINVRKGDKLFYNVAYEVEKRKSFLGCFSKLLKKEVKSRLMVCDIATGICTQVLDDDCEIQDVKNDLIFYTRWKHNDLNEDLHIFNMTTGVDTLIERNIYEFFNVIEDKVYYTIGNEDFRPLVRANFDGSEREQIMRNITRIDEIRGGWFYVTKGKGYNAVLAKIKVDGSDVRILCTNINRVVRFEGNYIYYNDNYGDLRVVRIDGECDRLIAEGVDKVFPAEDGLYYVRSEIVDAGKTNLSLYRMDRDGTNIKKIVFNIDKVQNDAFSNKIYFSKTDNIRYKVYKPKKEHKAHYEFLNITKYYYINKAKNGQPASEPILYLTIGLPEQADKDGCLAKFKKDFIYEEAPITHSYKTRGMTDAQIMDTEDDDIPVGAPASNLPSWLAPFVNKNNNATATPGCNNSGCGKTGCANLGAGAKNTGAAQGCSPKKF